MSLPLSLSAYRLLTRLASPLSGPLLSLRLNKAKEDPMRVEERRGVASLARPAGRLVWLHGASVGEVAVSGQFNATEIAALAGELFGNWKSPKPFVRARVVYHKVERTDRKFETPDKQNAMLAAGLTTRMGDADPDYPAMLIANYIFGGSAGARLFKRIRDKEGLSYGVYSGFSAPPLDDGGAFTMNAISAPQNTPKVEASFKDELAKTLKEGFTADEVAAAKKAWLQERTMSRSEDGALVGLLSGRQRFDRTLRFDESLEARVAALTPEQISAAFRQHIDPANLIYVKAGDFKKAGVWQ